jgi:class 3 adenylate cyclase
VDIGTWLHGLGLQQYEQAFRDNAIDAATLPELTAEDLKDLGVSLVGHRRKLLAGIAALRSVIGPVPDPPAAASAVERRQLTVMFCDLVGSTALSARLDPEDLREVIAAYHRAVAAVVAGFDGFVANYMGDGALVYFGYPRAHEDDAERAVRAALGVIDAIGRLDVKSLKLQARVGIATGLVVVGELVGKGSAQQRSVVGETPNLAARLQALAEPDAVVIAAGTRRLVGDLFEYRDLGAVEVKGIAAPVPTWQVIRPSAVESRFEALHGSTLTPLVGATRRSTCWCGAGRVPRQATGRSCWSPANLASASRVSLRRWWSASTPSRISGYGTFARPITRTVRSIRLSTSSAGHRGSRATTRLGPSWKSSRLCSLALPHPTRTWHS